MRTLENFTFRIIENPEAYPADIFSKIKIFKNK
jgi:hypothetical protein